MSWEREIPRLRANRFASGTSSLSIVTVSFVFMGYTCLLTEYRYL